MQYDTQVLWTAVYKEEPQGLQICTLVTAVLAVRALQTCHG